MQNLKGSANLKTIHRLACLLALECALPQTEVRQDFRIPFLLWPPLFFVVLLKLCIKVHLVPSTVCCNLVSLPVLTVVLERDSNLRAYVLP
jgi:hypothetical protein